MEFTHEQIIIVKYLLKRMENRIEESDPYTTSDKWIFTDYYDDIKDHKKMFEECNKRANQIISGYSSVLCDLIREIWEIKDIMKPDEPAIHPGLEWQLEKLGNS